MKTATYVGKLIYENGEFRTSNDNVDVVIARVYGQFESLDTSFGSAIVKIIELDVMNDTQEVMEEYLFEYRNSRWIMVDWIV